MTDNELLLCLSKLLDKKLKPLEDGIKQLDDRTRQLENRVTQLDDKVKLLDGKVTQLDDKVKLLDGKVTQLDDKVKLLDDKVTQLDHRTRKIELFLEQNVMSRLQNIESCYTSTYRKYSTGSEEIDALKSDMVIIKNVVSEHSKKLKDLSQ